MPTLAKYLLRTQDHSSARDVGRWNLFARFHRGFERNFSSLRDRYHGTLQRCLNVPLVFIGLFLLGCITSAALLPFVGRDFFPSVDAGLFKLHLRAKTGTRIEETARLCDLVETDIRAVIPASELATIIDNIGLPASGTNLSYNNSGTVGPADADIIVSLKGNHRPTDEYVRTLRQRLPESFPGVVFYFLPADIVSQILNFGLPAPIDIQVIGRNIDANRKFALDLLEKLKQVTGIADLRIQQPMDQPKFDLTVDRTKAQQVGLSQRDVATSLLIALSGSFQTSPSFFLNWKNGVSYQVITQAPQYKIDSLQELSNIPITGENRAKSEILGSLATVSRGAERAVASHWNVQPVIDIYGGVQRRDLGGVADEVKRIVDASAKDLPKGSRLAVRGQIETMQSSFTGLLLGLIFAVVLVYLLMVVNFQSWLDPFIIITALPAALAGIVWMLFVTHTTVSVPALTGAIMAMGIATANSILVVSFARERLQEGADALTAALEAGFTRFRPVLMTALAMIIGMVPMSLGLGEGGEQNAPLGRAVIGGLLFATVATLFFVPVVFSVIHGWRARGRALAAGSSLEQRNRADQGRAYEFVSAFRRWNAPAPAPLDCDRRHRRRVRCGTGVGHSAAPRGHRGAEERDAGAQHPHRFRHQTQSGRRQPGSRSAGQYAGVRRHPDLRADQRLSQALDSRYRRPREGGPAAGRDRHPGGRRSAPPGAGGSRDRRGELPSRRENRHALAGAAQDRFGLEAGGRPDPGRHGGKESRPRFGTLQRRAP